MLKPQVIMFVPVQAKFLSKWEYYHQDFLMLRECGYQVKVASNILEVLQNLPKSLFIYCWWWHRSFPVILLASLFGKKTIVTGALHLHDLSGATSYFKKSILYRCLVQCSLRLASFNLLISQHQSQSILSFFPNLRTEQLYPSVTKRVSPGDFRNKLTGQLLSLCWLDNEQCKRKGIFRALDALKIIRSDTPDLLDGINYVIAGKAGNAIEKIKILIQDYELSSLVSVEVDLDEKAKYKLLSSSDLLIAHSSMEGFGNASLEAMSVGVPVLCSSEGASKEVVGQTGLICLGIEVKPLVQALSSYLRLKEVNKLKMKNDALKRANEDFNFESRVTKFQSLVKKRFKQQKFGQN